MTSTIHVQAVLPDRTGRARDAALNTWTFSDPAAAPSDGESITFAGIVLPFLTDFYNTAAGSDPEVAVFLGGSRTRVADACSFRVYNISTHLNGSPAGPPILVEPWTLGGSTTGDNLPFESAVAFSFHGLDASIPEFGPGTRPKSRHRGRVFLGPLKLDAVTANALGRVDVSSSFIGSLASAGEALISDTTDRWVVWSRRNAAVYPVVGGWVDDATDSQRRRGHDPDAKTFWGSLV